MAGQSKRHNVSASQRLGTFCGCLDGRRGFTRATFSFRAPTHGGCPAVAYARREQSLRSMATFKGAILFILLYHGTWAPARPPPREGCAKLSAPQPIIALIKQPKKHVLRVVHSTLGASSSQPSTAFILVCFLKHNKLPLL
eukprot:EG_transcript_42585